MHSDNDMPLNEPYKITGSIDEPISDFPDTVPLKEREAEKRRYEKHRHKLAKDTWITIAALVLVLALIIIDGVVSFKSGEKEHVSGFLHMLTSCIMLVMGYLFGTRNKNE
jgi:hypothetical protein